jgi:hypothetical protein
MIAVRSYAGCQPLQRWLRILVAQVPSGSPPLIDRGVFNRKNLLEIAEPDRRLS